MAFYALAKTNELCEGFRRTLKVPGVALVLFYHKGEVHIIEDRCPHMDIPLADATLEGNTLRCRAHGIGFGLATGKAEGIWTDTLDCLKQYEAVYRDYSVGVEL